MLKILFLLMAHICLGQKKTFVETNVILNEDSSLIMSPSFVVIKEKLYLLSKDRSTKLIQYDMNNGFLVRYIDLDKLLHNREAFIQLNDKIKSSYSISSYFITDFKENLFLTLNLDYKKPIDTSISMMSNLSIYVFLDTNFNLINTGFLGSSEFEQDRDDFIHFVPSGFVGDTVIFNKRLDGEDKVNYSKSKIKILQTYDIKDFNLIKSKDFFNIALTDLNKFPKYFTNLSSFFPFKSTSWNDSIYISDGYSLFKFNRNRLTKISNDIPMTIAYKFTLNLNDTLFVLKTEIDFKNNFKTVGKYIFKYYNNKLLSKMNIEIFDKIYNINLGKTYELYQYSDKKYYTVFKENEDFILKSIILK